MCFNIPTTDRATLAKASLTAGYLIDLVNEELDEVDFSERIAWRFIDEVNYAGIFCLSLIETVMRLPMSILTFLPNLLTAQGLQGWETLTLMSLTIGLDIALRSLVALVQNLYLEKLSYDDLALCSVS
jgi:hypothetical protein